MPRINNPPATSWTGDVWKLNGEIVSPLTAKRLHNLDLFETAEQVRTRFFPGLREVEIGPGNHPILSPQNGFFIEPCLNSALFKRIIDFGSMRTNDNLIARQAGDKQSAEWIKNNNLQVVWMKNMPDLSEDTFSSFEGVTHVLDMTDSNRAFPWDAIDHYEKFENGGRGARKGHFIAHGFHPLHRICILDSAGGSGMISGTVYYRP